MDKTGLINDYHRHGNTSMALEGVSFSLPPLILSLKWTIQTFRHRFKSHRTSDTSSGIDHNERTGSNVHATIHLELKDPKYYFYLLLLFFYFLHSIWRFHVAWQKTSRDINIAILVSCRAWARSRHDQNQLYLVTLFGWMYVVLVHMNLQCAVHIVFILISLKLIIVFGIFLAIRPAGVVSNECAFTSSSSYYSLWQTRKVWTYRYG